MKKKNGELNLLNIRINTYFVFKKVIGNCNFYVLFESNDKLLSMKNFSQQKWRAILYFLGYSKIYYRRQNKNIDLG